MTALTGYMLLLHYISTSKIQVGLCQVSLWVGVVHVAKKPAGKDLVVWSSESLALVLLQLFVSMPLVDRTLQGWLPATYSSFLYNLNPWNLIQDFIVVNQSWKIVKYW